jgi:Protein of unknown function (DUF3467)
MSDRPEDHPEEQPVQGQVRYSQLSARVPEVIGDGRYASAVMVMNGPFETVLDFILRLSEKPRVVARVVLPPPVVGQFVRALEKNVGIYETNFGSLPKPPALHQVMPPDATFQQPTEGAGGGPDAPEGSPEGAAPTALPWSTQPPPDPDLVEPGHPVSTTSNIEQIYDELRLPESLLSGRYANAVLIRHSPTEFCFDFITNIFPRSAVSSRVYLSAANVAGLVQSLKRSISPRGQ